MSVSRCVRAQASVCVFMLANAYDVTRGQRTAFGSWAFYFYLVGSEYPTQIVRFVHKLLYPLNHLITLSASFFWFFLMEG